MVPQAVYAMLACARIGAIHSIVFGGFSAEHEVSVKSGKFIFDNLKNNPTWNIYEVCISKNYNTVKYREEFYNLNYEHIGFCLFLFWPHLLVS